MNSLKAILTVSFGTSYQDTREKTIDLIESDFAVAFPERVLRRAFTSSVIIQKLSLRDGITVNDVPAALEQLVEEDFSDVVIQPTFIINGNEYDKLITQASPFSKKFAHFSIGTPLLTSVDDFEKVSFALLEYLPKKAKDCAVVLMGHGTTHIANAAYSQLEYMLHDIGRTDIFIATVEGYPTIKELEHRLKEHQEIRRVLLLPLTLVAGDHAINDMGGDENSWRAHLESLGYEVSCKYKGLGEYPGIRTLFTEHAKRTEDVYET